VRRLVVAVILAYAAVASAQPSGDDVDVSGADPAQPDEHVTISGFADFAFRTLLMPSTALAAAYYPKESSFVVGNLNLYLTKRLSSRWRSFVEVRFTYAPNGAVNADRSAFTKATGPDPADIEREMTWGGVVIERAYLEYEVNEHLTIQAGSFLTPYGIWNVDHGSPAIIPVFRPFIIGENLFPARQSGIHAYGARPFGEYELHYDVTVSNGRGPFDAFRDLDQNKALGARLELETPWLGGLRFGVSGYGGRFTDRPPDQVVADASGKLVNSTPPGTSYDELSFGADVLWKHGPWHVQGEVIGNRRSYRVGERELARGGFLPDDNEIGGYVLGGYRFASWWHVMPFVQLETDEMRANPDFGTGSIIKHGYLGLNFRPDPSVALKINYAGGEFTSVIGKFYYQALMAQAAWAF